MPEEDDGSREVIADILRSAVQKAVASGATPQAVRDALGISENANLLHIQNGTLRVEIDSPSGFAAFVQDQGPSWVQYIDHRPHAEWEDAVQPVEFDPSVPVDIDIPGRQGRG